MSAELSEPTLDAGALDNGPSRLERMVIRLMLAGVGLSVGALGGMVIAVFAGLVDIRC
ncbi:MAG: hypothetical protein ACJ8GW_04040 [Massilia sp.]